MGDCIALYQVLVKYFETVQSKFPIDPLKSFSAPSASFRIWRTQQLPLLKNEGLKVYDLSHNLDSELRDSYCGGIVEVLDLNLKQEVIHKYDINGLYSYVRLTQDLKYPIGEPEVILNPSVSDLPNLFGLIKAYVYNDGSVPIGIPCKDDKQFNRYRGLVLYQGTTEELKNYVRQGARVENILEVLHYSKKKSGMELFGKALEVFDRIKNEGEREGNMGKIPIVKFDLLCLVRP